MTPTKALAEALRTVMPNSVTRIGGPYAPLGSPEVALTIDHDGYAAAILAALPPDWCGHDPKAEAAAWNTALERGRMLDEAEVEIARLRAALASVCNVGDLAAVRVAREALVIVDPES